MDTVSLREWKCKKFITEVQLLSSSEEGQKKEYKDQVKMHHEPTLLELCFPSLRMLK